MGSGKHREHMRRHNFAQTHPHLARPHLSHADRQTAKHRNSAAFLEQNNTKRNAHPYRYTTQSRASFVLPAEEQRVNAPEAFAEESFHTKAGQHETNMFVAWQMAASGLLGLSGVFMAAANTQSFSDPTGRLETGLANLARLAVWFIAHKSVSKTKMTDVQKDVYRARINAAGFATGMAAYTPQLYGGLANEDSPVNADSIGAGLTLAAYTLGTLRQIRVAKHLNFFSKLFNNVATYTPAQRNMRILPSLDSPTFENVVFKWGMSSLLMTKGLSFLGKGGYESLEHLSDQFDQAAGNGPLYAGMALLAAGLCFTQSGWHEMWRYNEEKIRHVFHRVARRIYENTMFNGDPPYEKVRIESPALRRLYESGRARMHETHAPAGPSQS